MQTRPRFRQSRKVIEIVNIGSKSKSRLNQTFVAEETKGEKLSMRSKVDDTSLEGEEKRNKEIKIILDRSKFSADDVSAYDASI